ncbi:unnamed protein product [Protopolystoma xenopodis]|uniref:Uncharacterized protein n=1 Tax=Protopolystoma xenopodis TaxID=117903 RepID=A0A3S5CL33_9PLAT|nr:unnamed protein product [Protopolystoma xenopodis]
MREGVSVDGTGQKDKRTRLTNDSTKLRSELKPEPQKSTHPASPRMRGRENWFGGRRACYLTPAAVVLPCPPDRILI